MNNSKQRRNFSIIDYVPSLNKKQRTIYCDGMRKTRDTEIEVGDLVNHVLMDEEWLGIVVNTRDFSLGDEIIRKAYVHLTSSHVFSKWHSANPSGQEMISGWVDIDFLKVISKRADKE